MVTAPSMVWYWDPGLDCYRSDNGTETVLRDATDFPAPPLLAPVWRAAPRGKNTSLLTHGIRGDHTLCGVHIDTLTWSDPDPLPRRCPRCTAVPPGHGTYLDLLAVGLTHRQVDTWSRQGRIRPANGGCGSGYRRTWPPTEVMIAAVMVRLVRDGYTIDAAHRKARRETTE